MTVMRTFRKPLIVAVALVVGEVDGDNRAGRDDHGRVHHSVDLPKHPGPVTRGAQRHHGHPSRAVGDRGTVDLGLACHLRRQRLQASSGNRQPACCPPRPSWRCPSWLAHHRRPGMHHGGAAGLAAAAHHRSIDRGRCGLRGCARGATASSHRRPCGAQPGTDADPGHPHGFEVTTAAPPYPRMAMTAGAVAAPGASCRSPHRRAARGTRRRPPSWRPRLAPTTTCARCPATPRPACGASSWSDEGGLRVRSSRPTTAGVASAGGGGGSAG